MATRVLVPVFMVVAAGWLVGWRLKLDPTPLAKLTFWILSPALIFESLRTAQLPLSSYGLVVAFVLAHYLGLFLLSLPLRNRLFPGDPARQAATSLVLVFGNCGNLGLPVLLFSYGEAGFDVGVVFLAANTVLLATLGVAIASWEGRASWGKLARNLATVPWPYAVVAVFGLQGVMRGSLILEGSMPTAVNAFLLAAQFNRRPDLAAAALLLSTVLSLGTLALTLALLGAAG